MWLTDATASELIAELEAKKREFSELEDKIEKWQKSLAPEDIFYSEDGRRGKYGLAFHKRLVELEMLKFQVNESTAAIYKAAFETVGDALLAGCRFLPEDEADRKKIREAVINALNSDKELRGCAKMAANGRVTEALEKALMSCVYKEIYFSQYGKYWLSKVSKTAQGLYITPLEPGAFWNERVKMWIWPPEAGTVKFTVGLPPVAEMFAAIDVA